MAHCCLLNCFPELKKLRRDSGSGVARLGLLPDVVEQWPRASRLFRHQHCEERMAYKVSVLEREAEITGVQIRLYPAHSGRPESREREA